MRVVMVGSRLQGVQAVGLDGECCWLGRSGHGRSMLVVEMEAEGGGGRRHGVGIKPPRVGGSGERRHGSC